MKFSPLGNSFNMQIRAAITESHIFINIYASIHSNVAKMVSRPMFSWSMIKIKALRELSHVCIYHIWKLVAAIIEKHVFIKILKNIRDNLIRVVSIPMFAWSRITINTSSHVYNWCMFVISLNCYVSDILDFIICICSLHVHFQLYGFAPITQ